MTGTGTQNDPYIVTTWEELLQLDEDREENIYIKFADGHDTSTIDFANKTFTTLHPRGWHINGNGWSLRNIDASSPVFYPREAAVTYIDNMHFVKCTVTNSVFVRDWPLYPGEWDRGLIKWKDCSFSILLVDSQFTRSHTALYETYADYPMFDGCGVSIRCEGDSRFSNDTAATENKDYPVIKDTLITLEGCKYLVANLQSSIIRGDCEGMHIRSKFSIIDASIDSFTVDTSNVKNTVANSSKAEVPEGVVSATAAEINDAAFLNAYGFAVNAEADTWELTTADFEQGSINMSGDTSSTTRIRTPLYYPVNADVSPILVTVSSNRSIQVNIMGYSEVTTTAVVDSTDFSAGWVESPALLDMSGYGVTYIRLVLRSNNYSISPSAVDTCTIETEKSKWITEGGIITNTRAASAPLPPIIPVTQDEYIRIFDMRTPQTGFDTNGLAILSPTSCKITEELNGGWNVILEHPIDEYGKWEYIKEGNYLKIRGQLFTINKVEIGYTGNSGKLTAWGEHIFYQLNDPWIPIGTDISDNDPYVESTGQTILAAAMNAMRYNEDEYMVIYEYSYASDLASTKDDRRVAFYGIWKWLDTQGMTPVEFILGSDGFISSFGGELYRDNFYFSIDKRMEGSQDNAFVLKADLNIKSIRRTVDLSTFCTHFTAMTEDGYLWGVSWLASTTLGQYPHNIVREKMFSIDTHGISSPIVDMKMVFLIAEGDRWFRQQCQPLITYSVDVKDLSKHPDYKDIKMFRFKVGDKGLIYDDRFGRPINLQITKTVTNGITGEVEQVQFGNTRSFTRNINYEPISENDIYVPVPTEQAYPLRDSNGLRLIDKNGKKILRKVNTNG